MSKEFKDIIAQLDHLYATGDAKQLRAFLIEKIEWAGNTYGQNDPRYCALLNELAGVYRAASQYKKSEETFLRAIAGLTLSVGKISPDYATTINNLAGLYRLTGDFDKAVDLFTETIQIYEKTIGTRHFLYASGLNNLGLVYQDLKNYEQAVKLHQAALEVLRCLNDSFLTYATSLSNLANAYSGLGHITQAQALWQEAIRLFDANNAQSHPLYAPTLATLYFSQKKYQHAEQLYLQTLNTCRQRLGPHCREYAVGAFNLSLLHEITGHYDQACHYMEQAVEAYFHVFGPEHPLYKTSVDTLQNLKEKRITSEGGA